MVKIYYLPSSAQISKDTWYVINQATSYCKIRALTAPLSVMGSIAQCVSLVYFDIKTAILAVIVTTSINIIGDQRGVWNEYFKKEGINHLFFSSFNEQAVLDNGGGINDDSDMNECTTFDMNTDKLLTRKELLMTLHSFAKKTTTSTNETTTLGMVGFPNVGKSSFINVLLGITRNSFTSKRVAVAAQPGKTKHFQTMILPSPYNHIIVCDCPGLVFPSFASSKGDLILNGVYPIAHIRGRDEWINVVDILCKKVPTFIFEYMYGISFPIKLKYDKNGKMKDSNNNIHPMFRRATADETLTTYCTARKLTTAVSGIPDYQPASRAVLSDYTTGKLLYCHPPPDYTENQYDYYFDSIGTMLSTNKSIQERILKKYKTIDDFLVTIELSHQSKPDSKEYDLKPTKQTNETLENADDDDDDESSEYATDNNDDDETTSEEEEENDNNKTDKKNEKDDEEGDDDEEVDIPIDIDILDMIETINESHPINNLQKNKNQHKTHKKWGKKGKKLRNKDPYGCHSNVDDMDGVVDSVVVPTTTKSYSNSNSGVYVNAGRYGGTGYTRTKYNGAKGIVIDKNGKVEKV